MFSTRIRNIKRHGVRLPCSYSFLVHMNVYILVHAQNVIGQEEATARIARHFSPDPAAVAERALVKFSYEAISHFEHGGGFLLYHATSATDVSIESFVDKDSALRRVIEASRQ